MARQFTLGKKERLKGRKLIEQLFSEGKNFSAIPFRVYYRLTKSADGPGAASLQFGVGVSRKNFKKAVDRNRVKRITREAYRRQKNSLQEKLARKQLRLNIFLLYTAKELPDFNFVTEKLELILNKLIQITDENISSNS